MNHNTFSQFFAKPAHLRKAGCCLYALLWLLWAGTLQAVQLTNIRGEIVPDGSPVIVSSYKDAMEMLKEVPEYAEAGKGPGFINIMAVSSHDSMQPVESALLPEERTSISNGKALFKTLKDERVKLPSRRIVIRGHSSKDYQTIVAPTKEGKAVNVSPKKLGKQLGSFVEDDTAIDVTTCFACEPRHPFKAHVTNELTEGLQEGGARNTRIRAQKGTLEFYGDEVEATGNRIGTVQQYIEGKPLEVNRREGGRVIEEDGTIRSATENELADWRENGIHRESGTQPEGAAACAE